MADPIRERILAALTAAIAGVSRANGFEIDVRVVERVRRKGYQAHDYPAVNVLEGPERKQDGPGHLVTCLLPVYLEVSVWDTNELVSSANKAMGAVVKGVLADTTLGGLCTDIREVGNRMYLDERDPARPIGGFRVELSVEYRHVRDNPYAAI